MDPQSQTPQESQQPSMESQPVPAPQQATDVAASPEPTSAEVAPAPVATGTVNTHLVMSIISFVVGGGLFAILAIVFSVMASSALKTGNMPEAESKAKWAKVLAIVGIVLGVIGWLLFIALMATGGLNLQGEGSFTAS